MIALRDIKDRVGLDRSGSSVSSRTVGECAISPQGASPEVVVPRSCDPSPRVVGVEARRAALRA